MFRRSLNQLPLLPPQRGELLLLPQLLSRSPQRSLTQPRKLQRLLSDSDLDQAKATLLLFPLCLEWVTTEDLLLSSLLRELKLPEEKTMDLRPLPARFPPLLLEVALLQFSAKHLLPNLRSQQNLNLRFHRNQNLLQLLGPQLPLHLLFLDVLLLPHLLQLLGPLLLPQLEWQTEDRLLRNPLEDSSNLVQTISQLHWRRGREGNLLQRMTIGRIGL